MIALCRRYHILGIIILFFLAPLLASAQSGSNSFTVKQLIGNDTTPPSVPSLLSAIPIAQTQIDISWSASTDNYILSGYKVFRDTIQIATTTLTTYSDSSLTASTTYSYFVQAFDISFNISTSSNIIATTKFPITPTSTPTTTPSAPSTSVGGNNPRIDLISFSITPSMHSAEISWETSRYAQFDMHWGRSTSYVLGFVTTNVFKRENITAISDLQPGTVYEYQLVAHDRNGKSFVLKEGYFTTLDAPDTKAPANVSNLKAEAIGDDVRLTWDNPADSDFAYVRVVRNYLFYPTGVYDGYPVYQNGGTSFFDTGILGDKNTQYYTVFSYDANGNISSGAIVKVQKNTLPTGDVLVPSASSTLDMDFSEVELIQNDVRVEPTAVSNDAPVTFRVAYDKLPEHLKAIIVTLQHPEDITLSFSFLLKVNKDKTYYEAVVDSLRVVGRYQSTFSVFDYQTQELFSLFGAIDVHQKQPTKNLLGIPLLMGGEPSLPYTFFFSISLLLLLLLYLIYRACKYHIFSKDYFTAHPKARKITSLLLFIFVGSVWLRLLYALAYVWFVTKKPFNTSLFSALVDSGHLTLVAAVIFAVCVIVSTYIIFFIKEK